MIHCRNTDEMVRGGGKSVSLRERPRSLNITDPLNSQDRLYLLKAFDKRLTPNCKQKKVCSMTAAVPANCLCYQVKGVDCMYAQCVNE